MKYFCLYQHWYILPGENSTALTVFNPCRIWGIYNQIHSWKMLILQIHSPKPYFGSAFVLQRDQVCQACTSPQEQYALKAWEVVTQQKLADIRSEHLCFGNEVQSSIIHGITMPVCLEYLVLKLRKKDLDSLRFVGYTFLWKWMA